VEADEMIRQYFKDFEPPKKYAITIEYVSGPKARFVGEKEFNSIEDAYKDETYVKLSELKHFRLTVDPVARND
jgi:hypothetical protein